MWSGPHPHFLFYWPISLPCAPYAPATLAFLLLFKYSKLIWPQGLCTSYSHCLEPFPQVFKWLALFSLCLSSNVPPWGRGIPQPPRVKKFFSQSITSSRFTFSLALTTIWIDLVLFICFLCSIFPIRPEAPYKQASFNCLVCHCRVIDP